MIPDFDEYGNLPVGTHSCTFDEFYTRFRVNAHRSSLCEKFEIILRIARNCGFLAVLVGGSFATAKETPRDMDLTWLTEIDVDKERVKPECLALMDDAAAQAESGWSMMYLPIDHDQERIAHWGRELGFCHYTRRNRGTLYIEL
jgi:hypothetical protein